VEPVDGDGGVFECLADCGAKGAAHVADDLGDALGRSAVLKGENQLPKVVQGVTFRNGVEVTNTPA
jgi:hypothetical protein